MAVPTPLFGDTLQEEGFEGGPLSPVGSLVETYSCQGLQEDPEGGKGVAITSGDERAAR